MSAKIIEIPERCKSEDDAQYVRDLLEYLIRHSRPPDLAGLKAALELRAFAATVKELAHISDEDADRMLEEALEEARRPSPPQT